MSILATLRRHFLGYTRDEMILILETSGQRTLPPGRYRLRIAYIDDRGPFVTLGVKFGEREAPRLPRRARG